MKSLPLNLLRKSILIAACGLSAATSYASEWKGNAELGFVSTSGNTDNQTINAGLALGTTRGKIDWGIKLAVLGNSQSGVTSAEKYHFGTTAQYNINERLFSRFAAAYDDDRFNGYDYQVYSTADLGYKVITEESHQLDVSAGVGYQNNEFIDTALDAQSYAIFVVGEKFDWAISENAKLFQSFSYQSGSENSTLLFDVGITANLINSLALKVAYGLKYTEEVPIGFENTDTQTTLSFVYDF